MSKLKHESTFRDVLVKTDLDAVSMNPWFTIPIILAPWLLLGCGRAEEPVTQAREADILSLRKGTSRNEVERTFGGPGQHQFSARLPTGDYFCVSYSFQRRYVYYYFLFRGDALEKILAPPSFDVDLVPYEKRYREIKKRCNAEKRIETVLQAGELLPPELIAVLNAALSQRKETFNVLPALIVAAPALAKTAKARRLDYEKNAALAQQFDHSKVKLGDTEDSLAPKYGPPLTLVTNGATHIYHFDSHEPLNINSAYRFSGVSVVTEDGLVTRIFCHDFFCPTGSAVFISPFDDPTRPNYFCSVHLVYFDDPKSPHMNHGR